MKGWSYTSCIEPSRAARLLAVARFDTVVNIVAQAQVVGYLWEAASSERLRSFGLSRASFLLDVSPDEYDAFFNSPVGCRAQYAISERTGAAGNIRMIEAISTRLITYAAESGEADLNRVERSLRGGGAKIWILEEEVETQMSGDRHAISYGPWESVAETDAGLFAPVGTKLEVKGGWLNADGVEYLDPIKANRSREIKETGWT